MSFSLLIRRVDLCSGDLVNNKTVKNDSCIFSGDSKKFLSMRLFSEVMIKQNLLVAQHRSRSFEISTIWDSLSKRRIEITTVPPLGLAIWIGHLRCSFGSDSAEIQSEKAGTFLGSAISFPQPPGIYLHIHHPRPPINAVATSF